MVRWLSRFFDYLDRYFIARLSLPGLEEVGITCFRDSVSYQCFLTIIGCYPWLSAEGKRYSSVCSNVKCNFFIYSWIYTRCTFIFVTGLYGHSSQCYESYDCTCKCIDIVMLYLVVANDFWNNHGWCYRLTRNARVNKLIDHYWKMFLVYLLRLISAKQVNINRILRYICLRILLITTKVRLQSGLRLIPVQIICLR